MILNPKHRTEKLKTKDKKTWKTKTQEDWKLVLAKGKRISKKADLHKPVLNKIMSTRE